MLKSFKLIVSVVIILISGINAFAQDEVEYKDVILDGKPAKLNIKTGEITLIDTEGIVKVKSSKKSEGSETDSSFSSSDFHIVKEDETLLDVSRKYKVSLTELKRVNNLESTLITKGQKLRVKNFDKDLKTISLGGVNTTYEKDSQNNTSNFHIVKAGETLYSLSKRYDLSLNEFKSHNNLNSNLIKIGQKLRVRNFEASNKIDNLSVWTVSKDDTLFSIAKKSGTSVEAIKQLNGLTSNLILIGQKLQLK